MKTNRPFVLTMTVFLLMVVGTVWSQSPKMVAWGSEVLIFFPNSSGDSFAINWEEKCFRRTISISGTSSDSLEKKITVRCPSYGADSVRIVLGNYNLPMTVSLGNDKPVYWPAIFKMPHIIKSGIVGDSIIVTMKFKGERNIVFFINELAYKRDGKWIVHHDFTIPSFAVRPNKNEGLLPVTALFLQRLISANATTVAGKTLATYRLERSPEITHGDTLFFAAFLGEKSWGIVYPGEGGVNYLTCQVEWESTSPATYFDNTTVYLAQKAGQTAVDLKSGDQPDDKGFENYPNPFNPSTTINYVVDVPGHITLAIYNILGQEVVRLIDGHQTKGSHQIIWPGQDNYGCPVPSGNYVCQMRSKTGVKTLWITLAK